MEQISESTMFINCVTSQSWNGLSTHLSLRFRTSPSTCRRIYCVCEFGTATLQRCGDRRNKNKPACRASLLHSSTHLSEPSGLVQPGKLHLSPAKCCQCAWSPHCLCPLERADVGFIYVFGKKRKV